MLNILLVEDDEFLRGAISSTLQEQQWKVTEAPDGRTARDMIKVVKPFDIIVSDIQMPFLTGVELLEWVKENKPTPFVLMTGFALIMETQKAYDLGADDFLTKPFQSEDLIEVIKRVCQSKLKAKTDADIAAAAATPPPVEHCKVSIEEFVSSPTLKFDVYVKLGAERMLKIGHQGDAIPKERIENFKQKGLRYLYIRKEDFQKLVSFNLNLAKVVMNAPKVSPEKKANFLRYTGEVIFEKAFVGDLDKEAFNEAREFLNVSMNVITDEPAAFNMLQGLNDHSDRVFAHSLCVSIYSVLIAKKMGWTSSANLFKLSLSGMFHDIGKKEIDPEIINKPRPMLSYTERQVLESHAVRGHEILLALPNMPSEAAIVAYEHHEDNLGMGFPRRLNKSQIHPFTQIVRVANLFAEQVLKSPNHPGMTPAAAVTHVRTHYGEGVTVEVLNALASLIHTSNKAAS